MKIIESHNIQHPDYLLHINGTTFNLQNVIFVHASVPVNRPTTRGGVYFSDKFVFKIKAQVSDLSISPLLSKNMLGPNAEFSELKITTKIHFENSLKQVTLVVNLTNSMKSASYVELNMIIVRVNIQSLF